MKIDYDIMKSAKNIRERGLSFEEALHADWTKAVFQPDTRYDYPEDRILAMAPIEGRLHAIVFTPIDGGIRIISFRKANKREVRDYEQATR